MEGDLEKRRQRDADRDKDLSREQRRALEKELD